MEHCNLPHYWNNTVAGTLIMLPENYSARLCLWVNTLTPKHPELSPHYGSCLHGRMLTTCYHIPGTGCLKWPQTVTQDRSPFNSCQTRLWLWTGFSYQKKILERRLAEADGLSFASFRTCSMPTNSKSDLKTFSAGCFVRECISIKTERKETVGEQLL